MSFFVAVDLDAPVRARIATIIAEQRVTHPAKWLLPDRLHLTVVFLAGLSDPTALQGPLDALAARTAPFTLELAGAGAFSTARAASVLWLGVAPSEPLADLRRAALATLPLPATIGPEPAVVYTPHITLARARAPGALDPVRVALDSFRSDPFSIDHVTMYESRGTEYRAMYRSAFGSPPGSGMTSP